MRKIDWGEMQQFASSNAEFGGLRRRLGTAEGGKLTFGLIDRPFLDCCRRREYRRSMQMILPYPEYPSHCPQAPSNIRPCTERQANVRERTPSSCNP